jgi:hypothetical protein
MNRRRGLYTGCVVLACVQSLGSGASRVVADQATAVVDARARPTGVIEGRVLDEEGRPVVEASVQPVVRKKYWNGPYYETAVATSDDTDDRGYFRLHSLPAGSYVVAVTPPQRTRSPRETSVYLRTYQPGTTTLGSAEAVVVGEGTEVPLTLQLVRVPLVRLAGTVVDSEGKPAAAQNVRLLADNGAEWPSHDHMRPVAGATSTSDGTFTLDGVPPGHYLLTVVDARGRRQLGDPFTLAEVPLTVGAVPMEGLKVVLLPAVTVRGHLEWAGNGPVPWPRQTPLGRIRLNPVGRPTDLGGLDTQVQPDGTFEFRALYGLRAIQTMGMGWAIDSLRGDPGVRDRWFVEVQPGHEIDDLRIVVTNASGWLFASVVDENQQPFVPEKGGYRGSVLVMPVSPTAPDSRYWGFYHASHLYSANGQTVARIQQVLPGPYLMAAIDVEPYRLSADTALMERARAAATRVDAPSGRFDVRLPIVRLRPFVQEPIRIGQ